MGLSNLKGGLGVCLRVLSIIRVFRVLGLEGFRDLGSEFEALGA